MLLLFGNKAESIDTLVDAVAASLQIVLEKHDSLFHGGDYYRSVSGPDEVILQTNSDGGPPEEPAEEDFPDYPVLLYVTTESKDVVMQRLAGCRIQFTLLRESKS
jgi:hypothetical protein